MSSSTASGAMSLLSNYGGNSNIVSAMVKEQEQNQAQAEEIASLRKQLAALKTSSATDTSSSATNSQLLSQLAALGNSGMYGNNLMNNGMMNPMLNGMNSLYGMNGYNNGGNALSSLLSSSKPVNGASIEAAMQQNAKALQEKLAAICKTNNIDTKQDVTLNLDSSGQVVVTSSGSDKDKLQTALRADSTFTQLFRDTKMMSDYVTKMKKTAAS